MIVPDFIEPFVGWRAWVAEATYTNDGRWLLGLNSLYYALHWPPGIAVEARCEYGGHGPCADDDHLCGIHAIRSLGCLLDYPYIPAHVRSRRGWASRTTQVVIGTVSLWGDVAEHADGWRAQNAYPRELYVPSVYRARGMDVYASEARELLKTAYPETKVRVVRDLADLAEFAKAA